MKYRVIYQRKGDWVPLWRDFPSRAEADTFADRAEHDDAEVIEVGA